MSNIDALRDRDDDIRESIRKERREREKRHNEPVVICAKCKLFSSGIGLICGLCRAKMQADARGPDDEDFTGEAY